MLAAAMKDHINTLAEGVTPKGTEPFGTTEQSPKEALLFWLGDGTPQHPGHRYDDVGMSIIANWTPLQIAQLDSWLTQHSSRMAPPALHMPAPPPQAQPQPNQAPLIPGAEGVLTRALGIERRSQGFPAGSEVL